MVNRQVHAGRNKIAGEWGHNPLPWARTDELPGAECYCGKRGCIETFLSGAGVTRDYRAHSGHQRTALEIAEAAAAGDSLANDCLGLYQDRLARSLASIINVFDPDTIVLGGGLSNPTCLYPALPEHLKFYTFSADGTPIVRAMHGDPSGVQGAAWLWPMAYLSGNLRPLTSALRTVRTSFTERPAFGNLVGVAQCLTSRHLPFAALNL